MYALLYYRCHSSDLAAKTCCERAFCRRRKLLIVSMSILIISGTLTLRIDTYKIQEKVEDSLEEMT